MISLSLPSDICKLVAQLLEISVGSGKGKSNKTKPEPTKEQMHALVEDILKEADFNTVRS